MEGLLAFLGQSRHACAQLPTLKLGADANDRHERAHWQAIHFAATMSNSLPSSPIRTFQDYRRLRGDSGNGYSSGLHGGFNLGPNAADVGARPTQYAMTSLSAKIGRNFSGDTGAGSGRQQRRVRSSTMAVQSMQQQAGRQEGPKR